MAQERVAGGDQGMLRVAVLLTFLAMTRDFGGLHARHFTRPSFRDTRKRSATLSRHSLRNNRSVR
jgi:hypothetical protein